jgi:hypothetical protein
MSRLEDSTQIESIVGASRHETLHIGRAVSAEQRVYIMHSKECVASGIDLRECPFSLALDDGIEPWQWDGAEDMRIVLQIDDSGKLVPLEVFREDSRTHRCVRGRG